MSDELKARIAELEAQAPSALKEKRRDELEAEGVQIWGEEKCQS